MLNEIDMERARSLVADVEKKASSLNLFYVIALFRGPMTHHIECRWGLFGSSTEADIFYRMLRDTYEEKIRVPFWINSNVSYLGMQDHGLLTGTVTDDEEFLEDLLREQREQM